MSFVAIALVIALAFEPLATVCFLVVPFALLWAGYWALVIGLALLTG